MIYGRIEGEGRAFVFIHGYLGMSDNWKSFGTEMANRGFQSHLLDMRNHGRSFHSMDFSYEIMAEDVKEYCDANDLQQIVLLGHSMGGKIAMTFATKYPSYVRKLIVVDIAPKYYAPHHQEIMAALNAVDFTDGITRNQVQETITQYIKQEGVVQFLMKNVYRVTPDKLGFRFNLAAFNADDSSIGKALQQDAKFEGETLFIRGALSRYILDEDWENILHHFPQAQLKTLEGAGHWVHADKPKEMLGAIIDFVD